MTQVLSPYRNVLRTPGALRFAVSGFVGRFPMAMMTIAIVLVVRHRTGSYGIAGAASAAHTLTQAAVTPFVGRLVDRYGQTAVVAKLLALFLAGIAIITIAAAADAPIGLLFVGAVTAGAGQPPFPSLVRARWTHLLLDGDRLSTALALESSADEAIFIVGPVVVTALAAWSPLRGAAAGRRVRPRRHDRLHRCAQLRAAAAVAGIRIGRVAHPRPLGGDRQQRASSASCSAASRSP